MIDYHSNDVDVKVLISHLFLNVRPGGVGDCLGVNFECLELGQPRLTTFKVRMDFWYLAEIIKVPFVTGFLHCSPGFVGKHVSNEVEIELAILLAFHRLVAFSLAVLADIGGSLGTINSWVTFLFTDTACTLEHAGLSAFGLGVPVLSQLAK
jgi:hypothetical protein